MERNAIVGYKIEELHKLTPLDRIQQLVNRHNDMDCQIDNTIHRLELKAIKGEIDYITNCNPGLIFDIIALTRTMKIYEL